MKIYDAHLHYGCPEELKKITDSSPLRRQFLCYGTVQYERMSDYEALLTEHNVLKAVLIPFVFRELDRERENRLVLEHAERHPGRYFPYALLDDGDPAFSERHCKRLVGLKQHIVLHDTVLTAARKEICSVLQSHDMILLLHTHSELRVEYVAQIARSFPALKIQIAHMGRDKSGGMAFIRQMLEALAPFENVFFDTSTVRLPEAVKKAVETVGPERILYGSDFPFFIAPNSAEDIMEEQILHILRAGLTSAQQEMIFFENFERLVTFGK